MFNSNLIVGMMVFVEVNFDVIVKLIDFDKFFNEVFDNLVKYGVLDNMCYNMDGVFCFWWDVFYFGIEMYRLMVKEVVVVFDGIFF